MFNNFFNNHKKLTRFFSIFILILFVFCIAFGLVMHFRNKINAEDEVSLVSEDTSEYVIKTLYYVNDQYVKTGNDEYPIVVPVDTKVYMKDYATIEEAMIRTLYDIPTLEDPKHSISTVLNKFDILSVTKVEDKVYINFSSKGLNGGSMDEELLQEQIVNTLMTLNIQKDVDEDGNEVFGTLNNIKSVVFLVDGSEVESLLGHLSAEYNLPASISQDDIEISGFELGSYVDDIIEKLGTPLQRSFDWQTNVEEIIYNGITFMTRDNYVYQITVTSEEYKTNLDVKVGDTVAQVIKAYGGAISNNKSGVLKYLVSGSEALKIKVNSEGFVTQILIMEP